MPGITVRPPRSTTRSSGPVSTSGRTNAMRRSSTTTVERGRGPSASSTVAPRRTSLGTGGLHLVRPGDRSGTVLGHGGNDSDRTMSTGLGPQDTVLCSGTLRHGISFRQRLAAARAGGFSAISLWGRDHREARAEGWSDADIVAMLDDHGLAVAEVDPAWWWLPVAADVHIPPDLDREGIFAFGEDELFAVAEAVGAHSVNAVDVFGGAWSLDEAAEAFARLCDRGNERGLLVQLEFLPWSKIPDLTTAWEVVRRADRANGGLTLDAWHYFRSGSAGPLLSTIPGDRILGLQLCDAAAT